MGKRAIAKQSPPGGLQRSEQQSLLAAAGLDDERQAKLLRDAVAVAESALGAMAQLDSEQPDWYARLRAAKFITDLIGAAPSKQIAGMTPTYIPVPVPLPSWAQPPQPVDIVDVQAKPA